MNCRPFSPNHCCFGINIFCHDPIGDRWPEEKGCVSWVMGTDRRKAPPVGWQNSPGRILFWLPSSKPHASTSRCHSPCCLRGLPATMALLVVVSLPCIDLFLGFGCRNKINFSLRRDSSGKQQSTTRKNPSDGTNPSGDLGEPFAQGSLLQRHRQPVLQRKRG